MRIAILSSGVPHPTQGASTVLIFQYIAALRDDGHTLFHAILADLPTPSPVEVNAYRTALNPTDASCVEVFAGPPVFQSIRFAVRRNDAKFNRVRPAIANFSPDAIICFDLEAAAAAAPLAAKIKTVWLGDLNFRSMWYNYLYGFRETPLTLRWFPYVVWQMRTWRRIYATTLADFDPIVVSSHSSEKDLAQIGLRSTYRPYPWPVPEAASAMPVERPDRPTFLFFGNLTGLGSRSAFHFMFREVIPRLRKFWPDGGFRILIAGRAELRGWVKRRIAETPEIEFLGFVDDLAGLIGRCHAVLAPLDVPVGNRSRILTAMALGGLVIAHKNAALGNPSLRDGDNALLFENAQRMVDHMAAAVNDPARFQPVVASAQRTYRNEFAPVAAAGTFSDIVAAVDQAAAAAPTASTRPGSNTNRERNGNVIGA